MHAAYVMTTYSITTYRFCVNEWQLQYIVVRNHTRMYNDVLLLLQKEYHCCLYDLGFNV